MSSDFELKRLNDKLRELRQEQERLTYNLMRTRRDEQFEIERLRNEFRVRISQLELRQDGVIHDIKNAERDLDNKQRQLKKAADELAKEQEKNAHHTGRSAYRNLR